MVLYLYRETCEVLIPITGHGVRSTQLQSGRSRFYKPSATSLVLTRARGTRLPNP